MPKTEIEATQNFFGPRFVVGQKVEFLGEKDAFGTAELFDESYGLKTGDKHVVEEEKVEIIWGTGYNPGGPQADSSYQRIQLKGVRDKQCESSRPLYLPSSFFAPVEESTKKSE